MEALKMGCGFALGKALFPFAVFLVISVLVFTGFFGAMAVAKARNWWRKQRHSKKGAR